MALAHTIESKLEAAYRRGMLIEKRRLLMSDGKNAALGAARAGVANESDRDTSGS